MNVTSATSDSLDTATSSHTCWWYTAHRPHKCDICRGRFIGLIDLRRLHMLTHSGVVLRAGGQLPCQIPIHTYLSHTIWILLEHETVSGRLANKCCRRSHKFIVSLTRLLGLFSSYIMPPMFFAAAVCYSHEHSKQWYGRCCKHC